MKNMAYSFVENLVVMVHNKNPPADAELEKYLKELTLRDPTSTPILVVTEGGGLSPKQRQSLNDVLAGREQMCAVISDATLVRGVVTALSWFNKKIKAFAPKDVESAFVYLKIPESQHALVWRAIERLRSEVGAGPLAR